jgi:hypothetical protein
MEPAALKRLLDLEPDRLTSIELTARSTWLDPLTQQASYHILVPNREIPEIPDGISRYWWHLWAQLPCSYQQVEHRGPLADWTNEVTLVAGRNETEAWASWAPDPPGPGLPDFGQGPLRCEGFMEEINPTLRGLLDTDLWDILDGVEATYSLSSSEGRVLGRQAVLLDIDYEEVEPNLWGKVLLPAERHTIWVDKETSILLRVGSWFEGKEFCVTEVTSLSLEPIDPGVFRPPRLWRWGPSAPPSPITSSQ